MKYKCEVCGKSFEPKRKDQVLCSKACKQKRYREAKPSVNQPGKEKEAGYSYSEWKGFLEYTMRDSVEMPFIIFCFLRKSISSAISGEELYEILNNVLYDIGDVEGIKRTQMYHDFKDKFLTKNHKILQ